MGRPAKVFILKESDAPPHRITGPAAVALILDQLLRPPSLPFELNSPRRRVLGSVSQTL
jgi:hypothetical protein